MKTQTDFEWQDGKTFPFPPYLSEETCDKDSSCVAYVIDGAGTMCWTLGAAVASHGSYFRVS
jgi:hypothetical protein